MIFPDKRMIGVLLCIVVLLLSFPHPSDAAQKTDPRCWTKAACDAARAGFGTKSGPEDKGFVVNAETKKVCGQDENGQEIGFCLPITQTATNIGFGGRRNFANIGEFIVEMFRYGIIVAGILSVIMIIFAGFQWTISGGGENIKKAQERIGGAVIGLVIALLSYTILNTINPMLVNFRLPQSWLINTSLVQLANYCIQLDPGVKVAPLGQSGQKIADPKAYKLPYQLTESAGKSGQLYPVKNITVNNAEYVQTVCGTEYGIFSSDNTCLGITCPINSVCVNDVACEQWFKDGIGGIGGQMLGTSEPGKFADFIWLYVICGDGNTYTTDWEIESIASIDSGQGNPTFLFSDVASEGVDQCGSAARVKGYFFTIEINDNASSVVVNDDQWVGGKSFCANLTKNPSCGYYGASSIDVDEVEEKMLMSVPYFQQQLFTHEEIKNGYLCDFQFDTSGTPNIGTSAGQKAGALALSALYDAQGINASNLLELFGGKDLYALGIGYQCPSINNKNHINALIKFLGGEPLGEPGTPQTATTTEP